MSCRRKIALTRTLFLTVMAFKRTLTSNSLIDSGLFTSLIIPPQNGSGVNIFLPHSYFRMTYDGIYAHSMWTEPAVGWVWRLNNLHATLIHDRSEIDIDVNLCKRASLTCGWCSHVLRAVLYHALYPYRWQTKCKGMWYGSVTTAHLAN